MIKYFYCFLIVWSILFNEESHAQQGAKIKLTHHKTEDMRFYVYEKNSLIHADYNSISQVNNSCPELLLQSVISANTQEWIDLNTYKGSAFSDKKSESYFNAMKAMNKEKNYFELIHKVEYKIEGVRYVSIKYYVHTESVPEPLSAVFHAVLDNGKWYKVKDYVWSIGTIAFMRIRSDKLYDLLYSPAKDEMIKEVVLKTSEGGQINFSKLNEEMNKWYQAGNEKYKLYFIDEKAW